MDQGEGLKQWPTVDLFPGTLGHRTPSKQKMEAFTCHIDIVRAIWCSSLVALRGFPLLTRMLQQPRLTNWSRPVPKVVISGHVPGLCEAGLILQQRPFFKSLALRHVQAGQTSTPHPYAQAGKYPCLLTPRGPVFGLHVRYSFGSIRASFRKLSVSGGCS